MASTLLTQMDALLIGTFVSTEALGFYDRAYRTAQWPSLLLTSFTGRVAFFGYARLQNEARRLRQLFDTTLWVVTYLAVPIALMLFISAPDLVTLVYGETWAPAASLLRILAVYSLARPLMGERKFSVDRHWPTEDRYADLGQPGSALGHPRPPADPHLGAAGTSVAVSVVFLIGTLIIYRRVLREFLQRLWKPEAGLRW